MIDNLRKLIAFLDPASRIHLALLFLPMLATAFLEMASIGLILPVIHSLAPGGSENEFSNLLKPILPDLPPQELLPWIAGIFAAVYVVKNIVLFGMIFVINHVIWMKRTAFIDHMFAIYLQRSFSFHKQRNSSELVRNLTTGAGRAFEGLRLFLMMSLEIILVIGACTLLMMVEPVITIIAATGLVVFAVLFFRVSAPFVRRWGERSQAIEGDIIRSINESFGSIRDVKLLNCYGFYRAMFGRHIAGLAKYYLRLLNFHQLPRLSVETVVVVGFAAIVIVLVDAKDTLEEVLAVLAIFGMASLRLAPSMNRIISSAAELKYRSATVDTLYQDMTEGIEDDDLLDVNARKEDLPFTREIRLSGLCYGYEEADSFALRDINLTIAKGETVGFTGPSGAGKTTLIDIILGLLTPQSGTITVDDRDVFAQRASWQRHMGFVPQHVYLVDDSLRRNIAFGVDDGSIDEARIDQVVRMARLEDVIAGLPKGLETSVGEHGARLSGGQRQRVAIARALYRDPDVLVFDEATASLDNETEREVTAAIDGLGGEKTLLVIAHRLSTVRNCDKVVFMKEGRIVAMGTLDELLANNPEFLKFAEHDALTDTNATVTISSN